MSTASDPVSFTTVSRRLIDDWLEALAGCCSPAQLQDMLLRSGLETPGHPEARVTLEQIVHLYQIAAVESGDEMMGLWSRPIRARALQHLLTTVLAAESLPSALHRFSTFWNLLLDDYQCTLRPEDGVIALSLRPVGDQPVQRFGHMLLLKLAHGLLSWLAGHEVPVARVRFAFARPEFAEDYAMIFPAQVAFDAPLSSIAFDTAPMGPPLARSKPELVDFVKRAPRDWIFTGYREHSQSLRLREFLYRSNWQDCGLSDAATAFRMTPRTLMRRLDSEGTAFQTIKDGLRRDIAIRDLQENAKSVEVISQELGFSSSANFYRAFKRWTGASPGEYRRQGPAHAVTVAPRR
ncbi:AraC family transcriptional regulator [Mameliella alba]|nr:AraC family transcriptional regulator [Mameliella alba]MBY6169971.1 AraC family transcriptional regulator [Mameliella alba]MBY6175052.1 AraC family transcriptional regulator [Mameliella alba]